MARRVSATPQSPERYVVGPGILVANAPVDASGNLIFDKATKRISLAGATLLGALDEGNNLSFDVEFEYTRLEKARGLIGNIGVPRLTQANASITGTMLEFTGDTLDIQHPGLSTVDWMDAGDPATLTIGTGESGVKYDAKALGSGGNDVRVAHVNPGTANATLSVSVAGNDITVSMATDNATTPAIISTAAQVRDAVNAHAGASALVVASFPGTATGTGTAVAQAMTALSGGGGNQSKVGVIKTPNGYVTSADQLANLVMIGERPNAADGIACLIKRAMNESNFSLSLEADETESTVEVNFTASYDIEDHDAATGSWKPPYEIYSLTPAVAV
jgi:hypothetical protein